MALSIAHPDLGIGFPVAHFSSVLLSLVCTTLTDTQRVKHSVPPPQNPGVTPVEDHVEYPEADLPFRTARAA